MRNGRLALRSLALLSAWVFPFSGPALAQPPQARAAAVFEELWRASGDP